jgi:hypothetical protein
LWGQRDWEIALLLTQDESGPWAAVPVPAFGRDIDLASIRSPDGWGVTLNERTFRRSGSTSAIEGPADEVHVRPESSCGVGAPQKGHGPRGHLATTLAAPALISRYVCSLEAPCEV